MKSSGPSGTLYRRLRAGFRREVPVWGIKAPVSVEGDGSQFLIDAKSEDDALIAEGFVSAHARMFKTDLRRRLWSGRLSEFIGDRQMKPGLRSAAFDTFVRILGFRWIAERSFRSAEPEEKARLEKFSSGVNAWIDTGVWRSQPCWEQLKSRPRLWTPSDSILLELVEARGRASGAQALQCSPEALAAGWPKDWELRTQLFWNTSRALMCALPDRSPEDNESILPLTGGPSLRWEGAVGSKEHSVGRAAGLPLHFDSSPLNPSAPQILPLQLVEGGDNHRFVDPEGSIRRLHARRQDIEVRADVPQRHWIRRAPQGGVISDLLSGATDVLAPADRAFVWSWDGKTKTTSSPSLSDVPRLKLEVSSPRGTLKRTRLIPLETGSW